MLKCKDCLYKDRDRTCGHGDYHGYCKLLERLIDDYYRNKNDDDLYSFPFVTVCNDSDDCKILSKFIFKK